LLGSCAWHPLGLRGLVRGGEYVYAVSAEDLLGKREGRAHSFMPFLIVVLLAFASLGSP